MAFISPVAGGTIQKPKNIMGTSFISPIAGGTIQQLLNIEKTPLIASVEINNGCNLKCDYCYMGKREENVNILSQGELEKAINNFVDNGVNIVTLAGKEIFFDDKGINMLRFLDSVKKQKEYFGYGFITNGHNADKYLKDLFRLDFDWMDISLDSLDKGEKSYKKNSELIEKIIKNKPLLDKFTISSLLHSGNLDNLYDLSVQLNKVGIKHQTVNPLFDKDQNSLIPHEDFANLFKTYENNKRLGDLETYFVVASDKDKNWIKSNYPLKKKFVDILDQDTYCVGESNNFVLFHNPNRYFRLTADGYILKCKDIFKPNYSDFAVGNVRKNATEDLLEKAMFVHN